MDASPDFKELLSALNDAKVRYLIVGAYAVVYHSEPRYTKDLDIWIEPSEKNALRVWTALANFGAPLSEFTPEIFTIRNSVLQIRVPPNRIDLMTSLTGATFAIAWKNRVRSKLGGVPIPILGRTALLRVKRTVGRPQDLLDVQKILLHKPAARHKKKKKSKR